MTQIQSIYDEARERQKAAGQHHAAYAEKHTKNATELMDQIAALNAAQNRTQKEIVHLRQSLEQLREQELKTLEALNRTLSTIGYEIVPTAVPEDTSADDPMEEYNDRF